jgi:hypothetical protein
LFELVCGAVLWAGELSGRMNRRSRFYRRLRYLPLLGGS